MVDLDFNSMSGCELASITRELLPHLADIGMSHEIVDCFDEEIIIDHIINSDISLENVIRQCCKALINTEDEETMMPQVEALIQKLL